MKSPEMVKTDTEIEIYEFRTGEMKKVKTTSDMFFNEDWEYYEIQIIYQNGDEWYAVWDPKMKRWESGDV